MYYFIPDWRDDEKDYGMADVETAWYRETDLFSDQLLTYASLFWHEKEMCQLIVLSYMPQLTNILHEHDLYGIPYWSIFDSIQGIRKKDSHPLSFRELDWPDTVEFVHTPFLVVAYDNNQLFAKIKFSSSGYLLAIDYYRDNQLSRKASYDARGFLSSQMFYHQGEASYREFYNEEGIWQFRYYYRPQEQQIRFNSELVGSFFKTSYSDLDSLLKEALSRFLISLGSGHRVYLSASERYARLLSPWLINQRVFLSAEHRHLISSNLNHPLLRLPSIKAILTDRQSVVDTLSELPYPSYFLFPCDTSWGSSLSSEMDRVVLYVQLDDLSLRECDSLLENLLGYIADKKSYDLLLVHQQKQNRLEISSWFQNSVKSANLTEIVSEGRIKLVNPINWLDKMTLLQKSRLIIDLSWDASAILQAKGLSLGIPQIGRRKSPYLIHQENAYLIDTFDDLPQALDYFLNNLIHWHRALAYMTSRRVQYQGKYLINRLKVM